MNVTDGWFIQLNAIAPLWKNQPTYIISQASYIVSGLVTLVHAFSKGGRWPYFWFAILLHGLISDNFWAIVVPEYDNFWHSQTPVMLFGGRQPLHVILLYPTFVYNAAYAISKLNLRKLAQPFAVGLLVVLIDLPYDIVAVKFVHWVWHDTDPNVFDRHYWVPWNSYYFHAAFTASFYFLFHAFCSSNELNQWKARGFVTEMKSVAIASLLGMFGGVLLFVPVYHPLHDVHGIHTEVTFFLLVAVFAVFVLLGLVGTRRKCIDRLTQYDYMLLLVLFFHYSIYLFFVMFMEPKDEVSVGYHQPLGPCYQKQVLVTPFGQELYKDKYLCMENYDEGYFDFHCIKDLPSATASWYTICGTAFGNRMEYIAVVGAITILAFGVFFGLYFKTLEIETKNHKSKQKTR